MRTLSFNVQNLRLRPGAAGARLDGARDADLPSDVGPAAADLDTLDRRLTARVIADADADVVALQEVFDRPTLDHFHDAFLLPAGARPYPHRYCLPGNDGRGFDVALMSRRAVDDVASHAAETPGTLGLAPIAGCGPDDRVFRRDCLEARIGPLALFVCHFKAPYPDAEAAAGVRRLEAEAVAALIRRRFPDPDAALWLALGDLNQPSGDGAAPAATATAPLLTLGVDLLARRPADDRWSFRNAETGAYARPDAMIASKALAARYPDARPRLIRAGLDRDAARDPGPRYPAVGPHRPHASDHAALLLDLPGL